MMTKSAVALLATIATSMTMFGMAVAPASAGDRTTQYLLVNANADGDTPVSGALVRANRCGGDKRDVPLRQRDGSRGERTPKTGVTLLEVARLPACYDVVVTGGRAGGRPLGGSFVSRNTNAKGQLENVAVTPVSTLVHRFRTAHPKMSDRRATRRVKRRLKIPSYYDTFDLQADDNAFDGDRYLAATRRQGGVATLNGELVSDAERRSFRDLDADQERQAPAGVSEWWKDLDVKGAALGGLKDFGTSFVWNQVVNGGTWMIGRFLDEYGLREVKDFLFPKSDTQRILEMVQHINVRINTLEATGNKILKQIAELKTQVSTTAAITLLTHIDTNHNSLQGIAKLDPNQPGRAGATRALLEAIGRDLDDRNLLHSVVAGRGSPGLLELESRRAAVEPFFRSKDSREIRDVYNYYVLYQLRFANLLAEYWNTKSCSKRPGEVVDPNTCLAPETIKQMFDAFQANIEAQEKLLKPPVPAGQFVDTKKRLMWSAKPPWVNGAAYKPVEECSRILQECVFYFDGWRDPGIDLAGEADFRGLIHSIPEGKIPFDFLVANAGLVQSRPSRTEGERGHMWLGMGGVHPTRGRGADQFKPVNRVWCIPNIECHQRIERVNLMEDDRPGPHVFYNRLGDRDPHNYTAYAMPRPQQVPKGTYWYE
jgi:hypothetical protein